MCPGHTGRDRCVDLVGICDFDQGASETCARSRTNLVWHLHLKSDDDVQLAQGQASKNAAKNEKDYSVVQFRRTPHAQGVGKRSRTYAVDSGVCTASTTVQSRREALRQRSDHAQQEVLGPNHAPAPSGSSGEPATFRRAGVLRVQRPSDSAAASRPGVFERRKWVRWWDGYEGPAADRSRVEISLAPFRAGSTHQLERARHTPEEPAGFRFGTARLGAQCDAREQLRQHRGDVLCESSGGSGAGAQLCRGGAVVLVTRPWSDDQRCLLTRSAKRGRGHSLSVVHRPLGVQASPAAVLSSELALRPFQRRRFCVTRELPNAPVLVTLGGPRRSQTGRASTSVVGAQLVLAPSVSARRAGIVEAAGRKNHRSDSGCAFVAQPALVARASINDDGHGSTGSGVQGDEASYEIDCDAAEQYMDVGGVSSLREMLKLKGYYPKTIDRVVERYESAQSGDTLNRHRKFWDTSYVPWCREHSVNAYHYDNVQFANFLEHIQSKYEGQHDAAGKPRNHAMFKHARAALGDFMKMFHPEKPAPADSPIIQQMARSLRLSAPNLPHYSETISLDPIFDALIKAWKRGIRHESVDIKSLRDWTLILVRIRLKCRSADVVAINRIWTDDVHQSAVAGLNGVRLSASRGGLPDVRKVRYDFPKNVRSRARSSAWKDLGPYLSEQIGFREEYSLCCPRYAFSVLLHRTADVPAHPFVDAKRPTEQIPRVFLSAVKRKGSYFPICASTAGSLVKNILKDLGFDVEKFKGHILRSASIAASIAAGEFVDDVLELACVSKKVFSVFYDLPVQAPSSTPSIPIADQAAAASANLLLSSTSVVTRRLDGVTRIEGRSSAPSDQSESSGVFSSLTLMNRRDRE